MPLRMHLASTPLVWRCTLTQPPTIAPEVRAPHPGGLKEVGATIHHLSLVAP
jgi:hypothetical protein